MQEEEKRNAAKIAAHEAALAAEAAAGIQALPPPPVESVMPDLAPSPASPSPAIYGPPAPATLPPMPPAEQAMVQQAISKAHAQAITTPLSAHAQAERIRAKRTFLSPRPPSPAMTERQQMQTTLSIRAGYKKQNLAMIAGLVLAGGAAVFLVSTFLADRRR
jgi:hypothetical protein